MIEQIKNGNYESLEWIDKQTNGAKKDDFLRSNFVWIIQVLLNVLKRSNDNCNEEILNKTLNIILRIINFNLIYPSPQRIVQFDQVDVLVNHFNCEKCQTNIHTKYLLTKCIKYAINNVNNQDDRISVLIIKKLLLNLRTNSTKKILKNESQEIVWSNFVLNTIRSVNLILNKFNLANQNDTGLCGEILAILKAFSYYGMPGFDITKMSIDSIHPSSFASYVQTESTSSSKGIKLKKNKNKKANQLDDEEDNFLKFEIQNNESGTESEFSSTDFDLNSIDHVKILKQVNNKIRLASYECLLSVVKSFDKKLLFGFWTYFIPDSSSHLFPNFNILITILKDPNPKVRLSAIEFLTELLSNGQQYVMTLAENRNSSKQLSFIPVSLTLALMISEIHRCLNLVIFSELNIQVLLKTFKCISMLINCTPYNKLNPGLLTSLCHKLIFLLNHKDIQVQNGCLILISSIFVIEPFPDQMKTWLVTDEGNTFGTKLIQFCFDHIINHNSIILFGESLKVFSTLLNANILNITLNFTNLDQMMNIGLNCSNDEIVLKNQVVQNLTCKFLLSLSGAFKQGTVDNESWWNSILKSNLISNGLNSNQIHSSSQSIIINLISNLPSNVFDKFEPTEKYHLITILFAFAKSDETIKDVNLRSSAIRCLGVYQSFPSLSDDITFLTDVCYMIKDILTESRDNKEFQIVYQSSWTLGNSTDIIKKNYYHDKEFTSGFFNEILNVILQTFDINFSGIQGDNIKTNLTRAIGSTILLILERDFSDDAIKNICQSVEKLNWCLKHCISFKLHWNICFAFSYLLPNEIFKKICSQHKCSNGSLLIDEIFNCLYNLMKTTKNHKVQCYAAEALCSTNFTIEEPSKLWCQIVNLMVKNYSKVPNQLKQSWIDKFSYGLEKLYKLINSDQDIEATKISLKQFYNELSEDEQNIFKSFNNIFKEGQ